MYQCRGSSDFYFLPKTIDFQDRKTTFEKGNVRMRRSLHFPFPAFLFLFLRNWVHPMFSAVLGPTPEFTSQIFCQMKKKTHQKNNLHLLYLRHCTYSSVSTRDLRISLCVILYSYTFYSRFCPHLPRSVFIYLFNHLFILDSRRMNQTGEKNIICFII